MIAQLKHVWGDYVLPMFRRPKRLQVAALCYRGTPEGKLVLLVTSRDTGRWVLPKGWPMEGKSSPEAAMQEAWEEAGVRKGRLGREPLGTYAAEKTFESGWAMPVTTLVYPVEVLEMSEQFPESDERRIGWFSPADAAEQVREPELRDLLRNF